MTITSDAGVAVIETAATEQEHHSYIDWAAIIGGIVLASAISLLLLTFGSAIGLSFTSFRGYSNTSPIWAGIAAASWLLWVEVSSFAAGGYLTGRMRRRFHDATEHESDVRDGAHGLLVWAGGLILGAIVAVSGLGAAAGAIGSIASTVTTAASNAADAIDPNAYFVDTLFRLTPERAVPSNAANAPASADAKAEAGRILAQGAVSGTLPDADKAYLAQLVASTAGVSTDEATARVDQTLTAVNTAKQKAADIAEQARKTAVLAAFLTAAALLVSGVGAYWAASMGGRHRDEGTVFADVFRRY